MTRFARWLLFAACVQIAFVSHAQQTSTKDSQSGGLKRRDVKHAQDEKAAQTSAETLHTSTQLVIVDVVVEDRNGHPVHGLTRDSFVLTEQKQPQEIRNFEEHSAVAEQKPALTMSPMPPGTFTNYTPIAPGSTLNVLLIDALNTPMTDQIFLRQQLLDYIKHARPGTNTAIIGLANRLFILQGFTTDPAVLRAVVEHMDPKASSMLVDSVGGGGPPQNLSDLLENDLPASGSNASMFKPVLERVQQFDSEQQSVQTEMRVQYTLDAFNALAHYLSNLPGRKNVIWFSGSFPVGILPDPTLTDPFSVVADSNEEFRETTNLLNAAQTAVYPVDARGLMPENVYSAANSGRLYASKSDAFGKDLEKFHQSQDLEHLTMENMASDTGGLAFYNTNGLADAVAKAIDAGSNYYTLTYNPADHDWNGAYRKIHVELAASAAAHGYKLSYRRGYYADDPQRPPKRRELITMATSSQGALVDHAAEAYSRAAISCGAPAPVDIVFKTRVLPVSNRNDGKLAPDNQANPKIKMKAPYRTFHVDYVAMPHDFSLTPQSDGQHTGAIEFSTYVFDARGNLLSVANKQLSLNLTPENYKLFMSRPVRLQLEVSAPAKQDSFLRLVLHDIPTNHYGVVEIPTAAIRTLPPLELQDSSANGGPQNTGPAPNPAGKQ